MAKQYKFVALVNTKDGADEAFNQWHTETHLPQVVENCGFSNGRRLRLVPGTNGDAQSYQYLVVFDLESDDPMAALGKMGEAVGSGAIEMSDTLGAPIWSGLYEDIPGATYEA